MERAAQMLIQGDFAGEVVLDCFRQSGGRRQGGAGQGLELGDLGLGVLEHEQPEFLGEDIAFTGEELARRKVLAHDPQRGLGEGFHAALLGVEEPRHELIHPMMGAISRSGMRLDHRVPMMGEFPQQTRLAILGGECAPAFLVDEHRGDAQEVEFVGAGELVLAGLGALIGIDANAQVFLFKQGVDEVVAEGGAILAAEEDVGLANGVLLA